MSSRHGRDCKLPIGHSTLHCSERPATPTTRRGPDPRTPIATAGGRSPYANRSPLPAAAARSAPPAPSPETTRPAARAGRRAGSRRVAATSRRGPPVPGRTTHSAAGLCAARGPPPRNGSGPPSTAARWSGCGRRDGGPASWASARRPRRVRTASRRFKCSDRARPAEAPGQKCRGSGLYRPGDPQPGRTACDGGGRRSGNGGGHGMQLQSVVYRVLASVSRTSLRGGR